jgi:dolichol-phosphate mannosyltransferase
MPGPDAQPALNLSIVVPVFDEADNLPVLWRELEMVLASLRRSAEVIFVDDGSTDGSAEVIKGLIKADPRVRLLRFKANAGLTAAFYAGFKAARGEIVVTMDGDLQNDPREIGPMLKQLEGVDAVVGWRQTRADRWSKRLSSRVANAIRNRVTGDVVNDSACSLRVIRRECLAGLPPFKGMHRFMPTLLRMNGHRVAEMIVGHRPRRFGRSKFGIRNRALVAFEDLLAVRWMLMHRLRYSVVENNTTEAPEVVPDQIPPPRAAEPLAIMGFALPTAALLVLTIALLFFDLGAGVFLNNDEARFPLMARDVLSKGNWLLPEVGGTPMLNKPPLHAWLIAMASMPGGAVTQRTAALPSALGGLGVVLATAWLGTRVFGRRTGWVAGFMTATTVGVFSLARSPVPDMTLTLAITAAMGAFALAELEQRRGALTAFYAFTGLAFLAKGPAGLIPLAVALVYELVEHGRRGPRRLFSVPGLVLLGLLIVPWPILALEARGHYFVRDVLVSDMQWQYFGLRGWHWRRLVEPINQAVIVLSPWSLLAPFAVWAAVREPNPHEGRPTRLPLVWAATVFLLIATSERQRLRYYLPLCPPVALLVAAWYCRLQLRQRATTIAGLCAALIVVVFGVGQQYEVIRRDRLTDLRAVKHEMRTAAEPLFATDSPDLVFGYYLNRSVVPLKYIRQFEDTPGPAYLITSEQVAKSASSSLNRVAVARVNGRPFVLLRKS